MHEVHVTRKSDSADGSFSVEWSADCLFVLVHPPESGAAEPPALARQVVQLLQQNGTDRVVVELDAIPLLDAHLTGELVQLHKDLHARGGSMRISGLAERNQKILRVAQLEDYFPRFVPRPGCERNYAPRKPR